MNKHVRGALTVIGVWGLVAFACLLPEWFGGFCLASIVCYLSAMFYVAGANL